MHCNSKKITKTDISDYPAIFLFYFACVLFASWFSGEVDRLKSIEGDVLAKSVLAPENENFLPTASYPLFMSEVEASDFLFSTFEAESAAYTKGSQDFKMSEKPLKVIEGSIGKNETFYRALKRCGVSGKLRSDIIKFLSKLIDFRKNKAGERFVVKLGSDNKLLECSYEKSPFEVYAFIPHDAEGKTDVVFRKPVFIERGVNKLAACVDNDLQISFRSNGLDRKLIDSLQNIFEIKVDFQRDTGKGDCYEIVYEEYYKDGESLGSGRILAASYKKRESEEALRAFYFVPGKGKPGHYYDPEGKSLELDLLKSPLKSFRLTSGFTGRRLHPIFKKYFPHYGLDLAAPTGTPVMAIADGRVEFAGWQRGFGRIVILAHKKGIKTYYGHLSAFGRGIKPGSRILKKEIIGYVGKTGVATGPHLDYRLSVNGKFKHPFRIKSSSSGKLSGALLTTYLKETEKLQRILNDTFSGQVLTETIPFESKAVLPHV